VIGGLVASLLGSAAAVWVFVSTPDQAMLLSVPTGSISLTVSLVLAVSPLGIVACVSRVRAQPDAEF
jgi:hypothetical protein